MDRYQTEVFMLLSTFGYLSFDCEITENELYIYFDGHKSINIPQCTSYWSQVNTWHIDGIKKVGQSASFCMSREALVDVFELDESLIEENQQKKPTVRVCLSRDCPRAIYCQNSLNTKSAEKFNHNRENLLYIDYSDCLANGHYKFVSKDHITDVAFFWKTVSSYAQTGSPALAFGWLQPYAFQLEAENAMLRNKLEELKVQILKS